MLIVDPAMADNGKLYPALNNDIIKGMRKIVSNADVILPNFTEAAFLLGMPYMENYTCDYAKLLACKLADLGPKLVIITGVMFGNLIGALACDKNKNEFYSYQTQKINKMYHGTGDIFSSSFVGEYLNTQDINKAIAKACSFTYNAIKNTVDDNSHNYGVHFEPLLKNI